MFIAKLNHELKTIAAGNQLLTAPFALNQSRRAGNLRCREQIFCAAHFVLSRVLRKAGASGFHQWPQLHGAGRLGGRERIAARAQWSQR
jgi:hypothetical protein